MKSVIAIDLGATSGRAVLYSLQEDKIISEEIHRFTNDLIQVSGKLCWNVDALYKHILHSIRIAKSKSECHSIGIDTWGVDYALIDSEGNLLTLPVSYRDRRTQGILEKISSYSSPDELYFKTGNQLMEINTLFQLVVEKNERPELYYRAYKMLMLSDYLQFLLTGKMATEKSIASTSQLVNAVTRTWNKEVLEVFEISELLLPDMVEEGTILGRNETYDLDVVSVCQHDTASAVAAIPYVDENLLYISCGTWSLIGTELTEPILSDLALDYQFTNELGHSDTIRFLKNCTGLWILEELRRAYKEIGVDYDYHTIQEMVQTCAVEVPIVDTDDPVFAQSGNMLMTLTDYLREREPRFQPTPAKLFKLIYLSLAKKYLEVINQLEEITGRTYQEIYLLGGGSKSPYFAQLIATVTNRTVITGLYEATSLGNALVQFKALGWVSDMKQAKELVKQSLKTHYFYPKKEEENDTLS